MAKNKITTAASQIEEEKNKRGECPRRGNRRGLVFFVILYVLRNYSAKDHPLAVSQIYELVLTILGDDPNPEKEIISIRAFRDYLHIITGVQTPVRNAQESSSGDIIRNQMGGCVIKTGPQNEAKFYYVSDIDTADIDIVRSYIHNEGGPYQEQVFDRDERAYINEICNMIAPKIREISDKDFLTVNSKNHLEILEKGKKEEGFLYSYRRIKKEIDAGRSGKIPREGIRIEYKKKTTADIMSGIEETGFIPEENVWNKNELYVKGKHTDKKEGTYKIKDLRIK